MGAVADRIKGYGEQLVIDAMIQQRDQRRILAMTIVTLCWTELAHE